MNLKRFANLFNLENKVALVTGAAQGNGMGIANALVDAGAIVIAGDLEFPEKCLLYPEVIQKTMDVTKEADVWQKVAEIACIYGGIDILINNAGVIFKSPIAEMDMERFKEVMDVNVNGTVICTKECIPYMKQRKGGRIVNISSSQAFLSSETYSAYSASKAAISHLTRIWGNELAEFNITVNALCPSYAMTPMMENSIKRRAAELKTDEAGAIATYVSDIPQKRILEIEEVANWTLVLCSQLMNATTGNNFSVTGGQVKL